MGDYTKKLISRSDFARLAQVSPPSVTEACASTLAAACEGKRIDRAHPDAVAYLQKQHEHRRNGGKMPPDELTGQVLEFIAETGRNNVTALRSHFGIGYKRAKRIMDAINSGEALEGLKNTAPPPESVATTRKAPPPPPLQLPEPALEAPPEHAPAPETRQPPPKPLTGAALAKRMRQSVTTPIDTEGLFVVPDDLADFLDYSLRDLIERFGTGLRFNDWLNATQKIEQINEKRLKNAATKGALISRHLVQTGVVDVFNQAHLRLLKDGAKSIAAGAISKHASGVELAEVEAFVSDILGSFIKPVKNKILRSLKNNVET